MEVFQTADWKKEKHVPAIEVLKAGKDFVEVKVSVGKEIPHPNTTEHHIAWIELVFYQDGEKFPYVIGRVEFSAHGASVEGANKSGVYTEPLAIFTFKAAKGGKLIAFSYCNIHGLWKSEAELKLA